MKTKCTGSNVTRVLEALKIYIGDQDEEIKELFAADLDNFLDNLANDDFFGTEAQCDPRGDQRD